MENIKVTDCRIQPGDCAFLIDDGSTAILHDTGFGFTGYQIADKVAEALGGRKLDYIFLSHSHYDHALATPYVKRRYPEAVVVAGRYAADIFQRPGAKRVMRELDGKFAAACGVYDYEMLVDELSVDIMVDDGDIIRAGGMEFQVLNLPGHTKCSVGYYCKDLKFLLGTETLGVYDGGKVIVPSYLVGYQWCMDSISRVQKMDIENLIAPHLGLLDREQTAYYIANIGKACYEVAHWKLGLIKSGHSDEEILSLYKERFWHGVIREMYPIDALNLNTSIMIALIKKELM